MKKVCAVSGKKFEITEDDVAKVVIDASVIAGDNQPLLVYEGGDKKQIPLESNSSK